jgi:hypothetical protein
MPIETHIDKARRLIVSKVIGNFSIADIVTSIDTAIHHPDFTPGFDVLSDHSDIGQPMTPLQMEQTIGFLRSIAASIGGARWAVIATQPASYGMMRMLSVYAKSIPLDVRAFHTQIEAENWLASERSSD